MSRYKGVRNALVLNTVLAVIAGLALATLPAQSQNAPLKADKPAAQDKNVDRTDKANPADKAEKTAQTENKAENKDARSGIDPVAIWDGRGLVPFHSIDNPKMVTAAQVDFLNDDEYVLALTVNGEARAYPTRFVWWHHFVNDKTDKAGPEFPNFLISYCSVCNTGIRYDPRV